MTLRVVQEYFDIVQEELKNIGDILTVSDERGKTLISANVAVQVADPEEAPAKKPAKRAVKK